jgi:hypothetical protein
MFHCKKNKQKFNENGRRRKKNRMKMEEVKLPGIV